MLNKLETLKDMYSVKLFQVNFHNFLCTKQNLVYKMCFNLVLKTVQLVW